MVEWITDRTPVSYEDAVARMEDRVAAIRAGTVPETVWLLEHPPLYTAGTSARDGDLLDTRFPVHRTGRGGQYTYHGPGQRVAYVMLDLKQRQAAPDIKDYVWRLEEWVIVTLAAFGIAGRRIEGRVGIWVSSPLPSAGGGIEGGGRSSPEQSDSRYPSPSGSPSRFAGGGGFQEKKIAAIGVRVRHWVTYHGVAVNVDPDLSHFGGIVPCGISDAGVTSMREMLGRDVGMDKLDFALKQSWARVFGS